MIEGTLMAYATQPETFACNGIIAVYQLEFDPLLLPTLQSLVGQVVVIDGYEVGLLGYGAVFHASAVRAK
jgi:hypothetical protein